MQGSGRRTRKPDEYSQMEKTRGTVIFFDLKFIKWKPVLNIFCSLLQGSDPSTYEMIQKIQTLQRRLIQKTEEVGMMVCCAHRARSLYEYARLNFYDVTMDDEDIRNEKAMKCRKCYRLALVIGVVKCKFTHCFARVKVCLKGAFVSDEQKTQSMF